jgi:hypothetical protein
VREESDRVYVTIVKTRDWVRAPFVAAHVRAVAEAQRALIGVEPIIDNEILVIDRQAWPSVLLALISSPPEDVRVAALTRIDAQRAVLSRVADSGGQLSSDLDSIEKAEAEHFPLDYRWRDAVIDLVGLGALRVIRRRRGGGILVLTPRGESYLRGEGGGDAGSEPSGSL